MKTVALLIVTAVLMFFSVSCEQPSGSLKFKTIEIRDFVKHPNAENEHQGLFYHIRYTYPAEYKDKAVLETLQQNFITLVFGKEYVALAPEKIVNTHIEDWKKEYSAETGEYPLIYEHIRTGDILFVNDDLLQMKEYSYTQQGGAHGFEGFSAHLFNLKTGKEYSRGDIFKTETARQISELIIAEIRNYLKNSENVNTLANSDVWTENTQFAITQEGVVMMYENRLGSLWLEDTQFKIPYAKILPCLREETPVWTLAREFAGEVELPKESQPAQTINLQKLNLDAIPGEIAYQGDVVEAYTYNDKTGKNIIILAESIMFETPENEYGEVEYYKNLYAYRFLNSGNDWKDIWRLYDNSENCFNYPIAKFVKSAFTITDLNEDGVAEIWLMYIVSCRGDVSPDPMFLKMYEGEKEYGITGLTKIDMSDGTGGSFIKVGGEYELDDIFQNKTTPPAFVNFAKNLWEKHIEGK